MNEPLTDNEIKLLNYCKQYDGTFPLPNANFVNLINKLDKIIVSITMRYEGAERAQQERFKEEFEESTRKQNMRNGLH